MYLWAILITARTQILSSFRHDDESGSIPQDVGDAARRASVISDPLLRHVGDA